ncbi:Long-chain-fatty-acid--CoA ligase ACSBG2 [Habropoda laboriosa]|uniref:long-chain-fatty-acid--CoA ligase n=2 Tax=Habropoda laboriosa TaxID=597456 RepID=A0A0L7RC40_9HYME|nr:PREDICTED: very long-chain-fatty-acid--CoA ligase bubblegum-like isoform X2 [Habropoda laboriosa]XP_017799073.1 PREDICTED: very long-chain-fatty-acid--CoA ligase bubblegum-like isoform X2 [Habropoda laboriosa]KOC68404.1 Long-chain-fatty-acid--CoA ligase ACSBG2 [Habropoda laboriosa]
MTAVQPIQSNGIIKGFTIDEKGITDKGSYYAPCSETGLDGPDQVLPSDTQTSSKPDGRVRIQLKKEDNDSSPPLSVPGLLSSIAKKHPNHVALVSRCDTMGKRKKYTYREYEQNVRTVAKAFIKLGLERFHSVCILGFNCPEWFFSDLGAIYAGGFAVGIYTTNSPEACQYCAENSRANIIVVEDTKQLEKILQIKHNLPHLKAIIQYEGTPKEKDVLSWNDLMKIGEQESDDKLNEVLKRIAVNECCTLVYTSGTVGNPKAVMLSHDNLTHEVRMITRTLKLSEAKDVLISYLPLSHVAAQIIDIFCGITAATTLYFADKNALKGSLVDTLVVARPTVFLGVPRVWEKIYEKMQVVARSNGFVKTWIASWAKAQALHYNLNKMNGTDFKHWGYLFAKWLVFSKVKAALGLDRCEFCVTGAAPLSTEIKQYFLSLDIPIYEAYGMSESTGAHTLGTEENFKLGSVGKSLLGFETKLDNADTNGEGEICMRGRHVFMGYLNEPKKTDECLDSEGWLHSGDLGKLDSNGLLYVTGRIKELIITAGGENIPPVHIEQLVLAELPALSNALLIGDQRKYLTILVTLKTEMDTTTGEPKDDFTTDTLKWLRSIGSKSQTLSDVLSTHDPLVYEEIDNAIKRANTKVISNAQKVQKFQILPHDFSVPTGELGPTLKVKRRVVHEMYKDLIEDMYK